MPTDDLPNNLPLPYLCTLMSVPPEWTIETRYQTLPEERAGSLHAFRAEKRARITLNDRYYFTPLATARTIAHELAELLLIDLWEAEVSALAQIPMTDVRHANVQRIRRERDRYIDIRLAAIPFWTAYDIPIPRINA